MSSLKDILLSEIVPLSGPFFFLLLQISTIHTGYSIYRTKSIGMFSILPFLSLLVNCIVWLLYGLLKRELTMIIPNFIGVFVALICCIIYHINAKEKYQILYNYYNIVAIITVISLILSSLRLNFALGVLGCLLSIAVSAAPLAVIKTVISEKSTASLPFGTSLILWVNGLSWMLYGLILNDPLVYLPNMLGLLLSSCQLLLFIRYGFPISQKVKSFEL